jgi:predicted TIM-barrel fold metal-dependent hydrolase
MEGSEREFRPASFVPKGQEESGKEFLLIDGRLFPVSQNVGKDTSKAAREMLDVEARLKHMDALGVNIQVLYPSIFLRPLTARPEVDVALCGSYNRWLIEIWKLGKDRLRWAAVLPLLNMEKAIEELRLGKENGACAAFMRGVEGDRRLSDPYFFPLYEEASRLDLPICVHAGTGNFALHDFFEGESGFSKFKLAVVGAFHSLVFDGVPDKFPRLRFGFIEVSSQWVPYAIHDLAKRFQRRGKELKKDLLKENRIYIACQTDDDLAYVLRYASEDYVVIGSDYGHADTATEIEALKRLQERGEVNLRTIEKILSDNPRALYNL